MVGLIDSSAMEERRGERYFLGSVGAVISMGVGRNGTTWVINSLIPDGCRPPLDG